MGPVAIVSYIHLVRTYDREVCMAFWLIRINEEEGGVSSRLTKYR